jgi:sugar lactone lactonase YvrE
VATSAQVRSPKGVFVDSSGNVFIADTDNNRIRFIAKNSGTYFGISMTANYIYTIAGNGTGTYGGDAGAATSGQVFNPFDVCADANGNVYVADTLNHRVRFIPRTNGTYFGQSMTANYIYTIVGDGTGTYGGDGGSSASAQINRPYGVGVDVGGNVYVTDTYNHRIRFVAKISGTSFGQSMTANYIYTIAGDGSGTYGGNGGVATSAGVRYPSRTALDSLGNLYITDTSNSRLRIVAKTSGTYFGQAMTAHSIYTLAGTGAASFSGDGGPAASASMSSPLGVSVDGGGNIYLVERDNNRIRVIAHANGGLFGISMTANYIYTIVGGGQGSYEGDGKISNAGPLYTPYGVATDTNGNIYLADSNNNRIRFVPKTSGSYFGQSMTANFLYTIAGNGSASYGGDGAVATAGQIRFPNGVTLDSEGNVYITDTNNHRIRFVPKTNGTYFGQSMTANYIYTIAGTGAAGYSGDDALATSKNLYWPGAINLDSNGNLYIADTYDHRIRFVPKTNGSYFGQSMTANFIYTIGGDGTAAFGGDGGAATSAQLNHPKGVAVDTVGNVYVGDYLNNRIRCIAKTSGTYFGISMTANYIYTVAGTGASGSSGDGGAATSCLLKQPTNVAVDAGGNMYIADFGNHRIRFIPKTSGTYFGQSKTANYIYKLGGSATAYNGENAVATGKNIFNPYGVFPGPDHMVYLTDSNNKIRMIAGEDFIAPSTSTLAASASLDEATISWASAGDDNVNLGNLTGNYRIQYATYTAVWSTSSTPTNATTVTLATTTQSPGSAQGYTATGLTGGLTYYFVLWSGDEIPNWSDISNTTSTIPVIPLRSVTITSGSSQAFGVVMMGSQVVGTTGTVVTNDGNLVNTYALRASTLTVGSPWQIQSSTPAGPDQLVFYGVFDGASAPGWAVLTWTT